MLKKICILSIDGGGIRGILPGAILAYIEQELQKREGDNVRLGDYFDLIAGTSTGGILTCLYNVPDVTGRPKFSAQQALDLYVTHGGEIFSIPFFRKLGNPFGLTKAKYPAKALEQLLKEYLGNSTLSQCIKPCAIVSYSTENRNAVIFDKLDGVDPDKEKRDYYLRDIARATSAAPTYFEPSDVIDLLNRTVLNGLIDGGVIANNPALCAYIEAGGIDFGQMLQRSDKPNRPDASNIILISIGTGKKTDEKENNYERAERWGIPGWVLPLFDIFMSGSAQTVQYQLEKVFKDANTVDDLHRLEPILYQADIKMDNASSENIALLQADAKQFIASNTAKLNKIITTLITNK